MKNFLLFALLLFIALRSEATVYYVDSSAANNTGAGTSWATAKKDLQEAINTASSGDEIWVKAGTYYPTKDVSGNPSPSDPKDRTFLIKNGVKTYGGFNGTETNLLQRNYRTNITTLNGGSVRRAVSSYHDNSTTVLDGFTIMGASISSSATNTLGAGVYISAGSPIIQNCIIDDNSVANGGGVFLNFTNATISKCVIYDTYAYYGSGIKIEGGSPVISNCVIAGNYSSYGSAGISTGVSSKSKIINCTVARNVADYSAGGMRITGDDTIVSCIVYHNEASDTLESDNFDGFGFGYHLSKNIIEQNWSLPSSDPLFVDMLDPDGPDNIFMTSDDGLSIERTSKAIEAGSTSITGPIDDITDTVRMGINDIGAYENLTPCYRYRRYVNQNVVGGLQDGSSWANAFSSFQDLLDVAHDCGTTTTVWVAAGTYMPTKDAQGNPNPSDPRDKTFYMYDSFKIYGGFNGTETDLSQRDIHANPTIFSGDIGTLNNSSDNAYHVMLTIENGNSCVLDGITIQDGYAMTTTSSTINSKNISRGRGAGLVTHGTDLTIDSCHFRNNEVYYRGGGIYTDSADINISYSLFENNTSNLLGGGLSCNSSSADLSYNKFVNNVSVHGGAIGNRRSSIELNGDTLITCNALQNGGAISAQYGGVIELSNCIVSQNTANNGGAIHTQDSIVVSVQGGLLKGNSATIDGGAIYARRGDSVYLKNCILDSNLAIQKGGAIYLQDSARLSIGQSMFYHNSSGSDGGGIYMQDDNVTDISHTAFIENNALIGGGIYMGDSAKATLLNATIASNHATNNGGGLHATYNLNLENSIVYQNSGGGNQQINNYNGQAVASYSVIQGTSVYAGMNNTNANPLFVDTSNAKGSDNILLTDDDGYCFTPYSPCLNASNPSDQSRTRDVKNVYRIGIHDIGAYEFPHCIGSIIYVDSSATGVKAGDSWANAFTDLQEALFVAKSCSGPNEIWVAKGTYYPSVYVNGNVPSNSRRSTFLTDSGIKIYGGFHGTETSIAQRDINANPTIFSGDIGVPNDSTDNCYHVFISNGDDSTTLIDGLIIEQGNANSTSYFYLQGNSYRNYSGGGIYNIKSELQINNCEIRNNTATGSYTPNSNSNPRGGGLCIANFNAPTIGPTIRNTVFRNNYSNVFGGAIGSTWGRKCKLDSCQFINNSSGQRGGAFHSERYMMQATNTIFDGNSSVNGGAISCPNGSNYDPPIIVSNCLFKNNTASGDGAVIDANFQIPRVQDKYVNCTFRNNTAGGKGGVYNSGLGAGILTFQNCYFGENSAATGGVLYNYQYVGNGLPYNKKFDRCVFEKNSAIGTAGGDGGGVFFQRNLNDTAIVTNCLFIQNYSLKGPVIYNGPHYNNVIGNCTFYKNYGVSGNPIHFYSGQTYNNCIFYKNDTVNINFGYHGSNSMFEQVNSGNGINRIYGNPIFVNENNPIGPDSIWGTADDGLRLSACSPAINGGSMQYVADSLDLMGTTRVQGDSVDMGAYEGGELPMQIRTIANTTDTANAEITDATGWTHYCNCDTANMSNSRYMLSLKKNGNDIGHVDSSNFLLTTTTNNLYGTNTATDLSTAPYVTADTFFAFNRYWQVAPTNQPASPVEVRFPYSTTDFTDLQGSQPQLINHSDMAFFKVNGAHNPHSLTVPSSAYNNFANGSVADTATWKYIDYTSVIPNTHLAEYVVNSFSGGGGGFGNGTNNGPLPVSYVNFSVYKQASSDLVKWTTVREINNSHFNVHRSSDAINFETLGTVNSKAGPSTNSGGQHLNYSFVDKQPQIGSNYYRLEQVDLDGNKNYSKVVLIVWTENGTIRLYPNPTNDVVYIDFSLAESSRTEVKLIDMSGRVVKSILSNGEKGMNHAKISMGELANGVYHIQLLQNGQAVYNSKVRKY